MTARNLLISAALGAIVGCTSATQPPTASREPVLTPERAKGAILEMMRSKPGQDLGWFGGVIPDEMAKLKAERAEEGWYTWTGAVRFNPSKAVYTITIQPPSGAPDCTFEYKGSFVLNEARWSASPPVMVSTMKPTGG